MSSFKLYLVHFIFVLLPETRCFGLKRVLLRFCGAKIGRNVRINSSAVFSGSGTLEIGDNTWIGPKCFIYTSSNIKIGSDVNMAPCCVVLNGSHIIDFDGPSIAGDGITEDVVIADGCWICTGATLLGSSVIGRKSIVAACSCTKGEYPDYSLIKGLVAKAIPLSRK
ncbi:acyltransferase [Bacteroides acidifaciens]|uniref:acyltransferase n=1 Tax=Bacteroides acidifaciens TaxID=85831 RepID=UPI00158D65A5|nr:acyltransferase [Bacteroides acidifaciens]